LTSERSSGAIVPRGEEGADGARTGTEMGDGRRGGG
jgi:hypothetical protein